MRHTQLQMLFLSIVICGMFLFVGCNKKVAKAPVPTPPSPPAPTATLAANPNVLQQGQSSTLTWQTTNADNITIPGLGTVAPSGSRTVAPGTSKTYELVAKGPGGTQDASTRVTVNPAPAAQMTPQPSDAQLFAKNVKDVFFNFNQSAIRPDDVSATDTDGAFLLQHPNLKVVVEGHCDDRGSEEYNLALGDSRAHSMMHSLEQQGVSADRIKTISYGKEKPFCKADDEQCWQANRRDHIALAQ